jgi:hypothetical protein
MSPKKASAFPSTSDQRHGNPKMWVEAQVEYKNQDFLQKVKWKKADCK